MEEIKVGEYVRSKNGVIDKVQNYSFSQNIWHCENGMCIDECNCIGTHIEEIVKHSKNIIALIEPGDIVNNHYVKAVYLDGAVKYIKLDNAYSPENHFTGVRTYEDDIKTILTKEQMEANQYVVKRNMETN